MGEPRARMTSLMASLIVICPCPGWIDLPFGTPPPHQSASNDTMAPNIDAATIQNRLPPLSRSNRLRPFVESPPLLLSGESSESGAQCVVCCHKLLFALENR